MGDETLAKTLLIKRNARALCRHYFRTREDDLVILSCFASLFMFRLYLKVVAQSRGKPCHKSLEQLTRRDNHNVKEQVAGPKFWSLQLDFGYSSHEETSRIKLVAGTSPRDMSRPSCVPTSYTPRCFGCVRTGKNKPNLKGARMVKDMEKINTDYNRPTWKL